MATIGGDPTILGSVPRTDGSWLFTVSYTACFAADEVGRRFEDTIGIHQLFGNGRDCCGSAAPVWFTATSARVFRKKRVVVRRDCYDAGIGFDQVRAWIELHPAGKAEVLDERCTATVRPVQRISGTAA